MAAEIDGLAERVRAALCGAAAAEAEVGAPGGARGVLELAELLTAGSDRPDAAALRGRGLDRPGAGGLVAVVARSAVTGLAWPADRPRLRRAAHRCARLGAGDQGTAVTAVAAAVLAADLLRFELDWALVRVRQTLLEEAPAALLGRLEPLAASDAAVATLDPVAGLQLAVTLLGRHSSVPEVVGAAALLDGEPETVAAVAVLSALLAGSRDGAAGMDEGWLDRVPGAERLASAAGRLVAAGGG